ncbi:hypothetical protein HYY69_04860 [Candidatus Woesearchaeota archaeon]|nr:hypothetical protein [Candidatus Woesearchaeota archaeon]
MINPRRKGNDNPSEANILSWNEYATVCSVSHIVKSKEIKLTAIIPI